MSNLDISQKLLVGIWNNRDFSLIDQHLHPNIINHDPTGNTQGIEAAHQFTSGMVNAFPDVRVTIHDAWEDGDTVTTQVTFNGTHQGELMGIPPTGKKASVDVTITDRYENGKIVESWAEWDPNDMMRQLGVG
jgi:predicted ester cyclase